MKASEMRTTKPAEYDALESNLRAELVKLQMEVRLGQGGNSGKLGQVKRDIARLLTIRRESALGLNADLITKAGKTAGDKAKKDSHKAKKPVKKPTKKK